MDLLAKAVTLKSIRLHDRLAGELLFSAKHAVLYRFTGGSWAKTETEGCLAVYSRAESGPVLIILNRLQPENFSCSLGEVGEVELEGELLMLKVGQEVMGIWLFDANERQALLQLILAQRAGTQPATAPPTLKPISLTDLLTAKVTAAGTEGLESRLRKEFLGHNFVEVKEFARAVARFITLDPTTVQSLFEELRSNK